MTPFDAAWALLKSDPRMQAYEIGTTSGMALQHPDYERANPRHSPDLRNRGTIDPNVMMYRPHVSTQVHTGDSDYSIRHSPFGEAHDAFESVDPHGFSRVPRPYADTHSPPPDSPQHLIDDMSRRFMYEEYHNPATPKKNEAVLEERIRRALENR